MQTYLSLQMCLIMKKAFWLLLALSGLSACEGGYQEERLHGKWVGISVTEEGTPLAVDPGLIQLEFSPDETYTYESTLNYREAGTYFIEADFLYTNDTLNQASTQKAVELLQLTADSLKIRMMEGKKERRLTLVKP